MRAYLVKRAFRGLLVIWLVSTVVFLALRTIGDRPELSRTPLHSQYASFLVAAAQGDMGRSFRYRLPALPLVLNRLPATLELAGSALFLGVVVGGGLGVVAATRPNSWMGRITVSVALLGQATPVFWLGIMLMMLFSVRLDWLPVAGRGGLSHLVLPAACLSGFTVASIARLIRSTLLDVMSQDYIRTARAKGLTTSVIVARHALKNTALPVLTVAGLQLAALLSGAVVVEIVFGWPGMGSLVFSAIKARDYPLVQSVTIVFGVAVVLVNLLVDVLYAYVDPRIRYE